MHVPYQASVSKDHEDNPTPDNQVHPKQVLDDQPNRTESKFKACQFTEATVGEIGVPFLVDFLPRFLIGRSEVHRMRNPKKRLRMFALPQKKAGTYSCNAHIPEVVESTSVCGRDTDHMLTLSSYP